EGLRPRLVESGDQPTHCLQRDWLAERITVLLSPTTEVRMPVRPVVELDPVQVQASGAPHDISEIATRRVGGDETVAQAATRGLGDLHSRSGDRPVQVHLDAVTTDGQRFHS